MSNWFKKISQYPKIRWSFSVEADAWVPRKNINEESEKETANYVLRTALNKVEGDASQLTGIKSSVKFNIQFEPLKR